MSCTNKCLWPHGEVDAQNQPGIFHRQVVVHGDVAGGKGALDANRALRFQRFANSPVPGLRHPAEQRHLGGQAVLGLVPREPEGVKGVSTQCGAPIGWLNSNRFWGIPRACFGWRTGNQANLRVLGDPLSPPRGPWISDATRCNTCLVSIRPRSPGTCNSHRCPFRGNRWVSLVDDQTTR